MKNKFGILFAAVLIAFLIPLGASAQDQDLLKRLKLVPEPDSLPAPHFISVTPEGTEMSIEDLKGKLVVLNFWATWCPPCRLEMPSMERLYQEFKGKGLEVVAINFMEGPESITPFLKENGLNFTILLDRNGEIAQSYGVHALPVTFLIGREGKLLARSIGYKDWHKKEIREFISSLLKNEAIINQRPKAEARADFWPGDREGQLLVLGIVVLFLLLASSLLLWFKKARVRGR